MNVLVIRTTATEVIPKQYNLQEIGLARALVREGHTCSIVYYSRASSSRVETMIVPGGQIDIYYMPARNILGSAWFGNEVDELVKRCDVIQVSEYDRLYSWKIYRKHSNVIVYHGPYKAALHGIGDRFRRIRNVMFDGIFNSVGRNREVHVLSKSKLATDLLRGKGFTQARTVGVGLDPSKFEECSSVETKTRYNLLAIGRLHPNKNQLFLLDVFQRCLAQEPDMHLFLIGDGSGSYAESVKERIDSSLSDSVTYIPQVEQTDVGRFYRACDLFILPSTYEIFGMVLLEAAWFSCPIVSSFNGGASTLIEKSSEGLIVRGFDPVVWADVVVHALHDRVGRKIMAKSLRDKVQTQFTWDAMVGDFIDEYHAALSN